MSAFTPVVAQDARLSNTCETTFCTAALQPFTLPVGHTACNEIGKTHSMPASGAIRGVTSNLLDKLQLGGCQCSTSA